MGYFTLDLARRVGPAGRVVAVDVQSKMLQVLRRRARKAGVDCRIDSRLVTQTSLNLNDLSGQVDFASLCAVLHEMVNPESAIAELAAAMKPGAELMLMEPSGHVTAAEFHGELGIFEHAGFTLTELPVFRRSRTAVLRRGEASFPAGERLASQVRL